VVGHRDLGPAASMVTPRPVKRTIVRGNSVMHATSDRHGQCLANGWPTVGQGAGPWPATMDMVHGPWFRDGNHGPGQAWAKQPWGSFALTSLKWSKQCSRRRDVANLKQGIDGLQEGGAEADV
jgi:hypothetical protein